MFLLHLVRPTGSHPAINFILLELPQAAHAVSRHGVLFDSLVDRISAHPQVLTDFLDGQPSVFRSRHFSNLPQCASPVTRIEVNKTPDRNRTQ